MALTPEEIPPTTPVLQTAMPWAPEPLVESIESTSGKPATKGGAWEGIVNAVVFPRQDPDGVAWRIVKVQADKVGDPDTWVGEMAPVRRGMKYLVTGELDQGGKYGAQIKVTSIAPVVENTPAAILAYLSSGAIPHIREAVAKKIVKHFGAETLTVLDTAPWLLVEVPGIKAGPRLDKIIASWTENRSTHAILGWLLSHGLTSHQAKKIFEEHGAQTIDIVMADPYQLSADVDGIGFKRADEIAQKMGVALDSPKRDLAAVKHVIDQAAGNDGHCYLERADVVRKAARLIQAPESRTAIATAALIQSKHLDAIDIPDGFGEQAVFSRRLADAEKGVARRMLALLRATPSVKAGGVIGETRAAFALKAFEERSGITLAPEQRDAVMTAARSTALVITGGPGTGKSASLSAILELFKGLSVIMCSPTGKAAMRMKEMTGLDANTIHTTLGYNGDGFSFNSFTPLNAGVMIVDEASMLDLSLMESLLDAIPLGSRLILIGDVDQLPSVGPGAVLRDVIASGVIPTVRLTQVWRQAKGSKITVAAQAINAGKMPESDVGGGGEFYLMPRQDGAPVTPEGAADMVLRLACERIPAAYGYDLLKGEIMVMSPMHDGDAGTINLNEILRARLNPPGPPELKRGERTYRVGDRVIEKKNDIKRGICNGDTGNVIEIRKATDDDSTVLVAQFGDRRVAYEAKKLSSLKLAYAISIHGAQGSEASAVIVVMLKTHFVMLARNIVYTAVTRGKKLVNLITDSFAMRTALKETKRGSRLTLLAERLKGLV